MEIDEEEPKKTSRATIIRRALVVVLVFACAGGWIYTRYLVKKETLGGPCSFDMHCRSEAPRCAKASAEGEGVCTRPCDTDGDCAIDIKCVKVELDSYDERGRPLTGGYCFPQALLDARKKKPAREAGAPRDSWIDVPETAGQLEGEITVGSTVYEVKGSLLRVNKKGHGRTILDTSSMRVYSVDDEKKTFTASQIASPPGDVKLTKTDRKDVVADRPCEIWQIEDGKMIQETCIIKGGAFVDPNARTAAGWQRELAVRGAFALRVTEGDKTKHAATKVDLHALDPSLFAIPKAYRNMH
jgi:hypothetical protein